FFSQAEDGIRDATVTGVQTCALPISASSASPPNLLWYTPTDNNNMHDGSVSTGDAYIQNFLVGSGSLTSPSPGSLFATSIFQPRSEERRVGKEWRPVETR